MITAASNFLMRFRRFLQPKHSKQDFWAEDAVFMSLYETIRHETLVDLQRLYFIYQLARRVTLLPGNVAQLGVYKGGSAKLLATVFASAQKKVYLFDTFAGFPENVESRDQTIFTDTSFAAVSAYLASFPNVHIVRGTFPQTATVAEKEQFSFVYLDADLYQSTRDGLEFFYPKMIQGGTIVIDDYGSRKWGGVTRAVDEFAKINGLTPIRTAYSQCFIDVNTRD